MRGWPGTKFFISFPFFLPSNFFSFVQLTEWELKWYGSLKEAFVRLNVVVCYHCVPHLLSKNEINDVSLIKIVTHMIVSFAVGQ